MLVRCAFLAVLFVAAMVAAAGKAAASAQVFNVAAFAEAQRQGKPTLVAIDARWCPVCLVQRTILWTLMHSDRYGRITYLVVDFDDQKGFARALGARLQSTLIVFKDGVERGRSVGETNDRSIVELIDRIL